MCGFGAVETVPRKKNLTVGPGRQRKKIKEKGKRKGRGGEG
jgi:hypothetical protein